MGILSAKLNFAFLCDYASVSRDGKLSMNGIFETINAKSFPTYHPIMYSVANFSGVINRDKFTCALVSCDVPEVKMALIQSEVMVDMKQNFGFVGQFVNIKYEKPGKYMIKFYIDNREVGAHQFQVNMI